MIKGAIHQGSGCMGVCSHARSANLRPNISWPTYHQEQRRSPSNVDISFGSQNLEGRGVLASRPPIIRRHRLKRSSKHLSLNSLPTDPVRLELQTQMFRTRVRLGFLQYKLTWLILYTRMFTYVHKPLHTHIHAHMHGSNHA